MAGKSGHLECSDPRQLPGAELTLGPPDVPVVSSVVPTPPTHAPSWTPLLQLCLCSGFAVPSGCSSSSSIVFINQEAWMSGSRKSKVSLSCTACMCVCVRERERMSDLSLQSCTLSHSHPAMLTFTLKLYCQPAQSLELVHCPQEMSSVG